MSSWVEFRLLLWPGDTGTLSSWWCRGLRGWLALARGRKYFLTCLLLYFPSSWIRWVHGYCWPPSWWLRQLLLYVGNRPSRRRLRQSAEFFCSWRQVRRSLAACRSSQRCFYGWVLCWRSRRWVEEFRRFHFAVCYIAGLILTR